MPGVFQFYMPGLGHQMPGPVPGKFENVSCNYFPSCPSKLNIAAYFNNFDEINISTANAGCIFILYAASQLPDAGSKAGLT
jgi:hypothetical protein